MNSTAFKLIFVLLILITFLSPVMADDPEDQPVTIYQEVFSSPDYLVTTGDVYTLSYNANNSAIKYTIIVDFTYKVRVSNLGIIDAKGKTFLELKSEVERIVSSNYPMSGVQLVLSVPSTFKVTIKGEVDSVQETRVSGLVRLSSVIAGRGSEYASSRFVTVEDEEGKINQYDLFKAKRFGELDQDPYVRPNDIITIEKAGRRVTISGSVERPGTYELLDGENLNALVEYYGGGLDPYADKASLTLTRRLTDADKSGEVFYLGDISKNYNYKLINLDTVFIGSKASLQGTIFVQGAIAVETEQSSTDSTVNAMLTQSASFRFEEGETFAHFAKNHRSLFSDAADLTNSYVYRNGRKISIDLYSMVFNPDYENGLKLQADDIIVVPFRQYFVTVAGAVGEPGRYPYIPDRKWDYYVALAGGYDQTINNPETIEIRTPEGKMLSVDDYILPETTITAPSMLRVMISGEVIRHQQVTVNSSLTRLSSVVSSYRTAYSSSRFVTVTDKDGKTRKYDFFLMDRFGDLSQDPYVKDGDTIKVERAGRRVTISGSVERPGTYELLDGENLRTLIEYYGGGLDPLADISSISLSRSLTGTDKAGEVIYLGEEAIVDDYSLVNLDSISIGVLSDLRRTMFIQGAVNVQISETLEGEVPTNNIRYQFESGETYLSFVRNHKTWFTDVSDYERTYVSRKGQRLPINLYKMLFDPDYEDSMQLEADDILVVPFKQYFVTVSGAVRVPGRYAYVPDRTWDYYVGLAGGLNPELNRKEKVDIWTSEGQDLEKSDFILPETTIDAKTNSFGYWFNKYASPLLTILSILTSSIAVYTFLAR